jgi:hypothetical protein
MPDKLPMLQELQLRISGQLNDGFYVQIVLLEHQWYPPEPRHEKYKIVFPEGRIVSDGGTLVPTEVIYAASLPRTLNHLNQLSSTVRERARIPMLDLTRAIFQPPYSDLPFGSLSFDPNSSQPAKLSRISIAYDHPTLDAVPWELMRWEMEDDAELRQRCTILRRSPHNSGEKSGSFDLPVNVAIRTLTHQVAPHEVREWGNELFDAFTVEARRLGGIEWGEGGGAMKFGEAHHIIFDSADPSSLTLLEDYIEEIGRTGSDSSRWSVPPRLLVLHDVSADGSPFLHAHLVREAQASGADAVLLAVPNSNGPQAGNFFPTFYRKLMHNWPLDQCLWAAQEAARANDAQVDCIFGARKDGEFGLLLTRAVLEAIQRKAVPKESPPWKRPLETPGTLGGRVSRVRSELINDTRRIVHDKRESILEEVSAKLNEITFDEELHGVNRVVQVRKMADDARHVSAEGERFLEALYQTDAEELERDLVRLTNLWITENDAQQKTRLISAYDYLVRLRPYNLHLQIGPLREGALVADRFNEESLKKVFEKVDEVLLDVMFFSTDADFKLEGEQLEMAEYDEKSSRLMPVDVDGEVVMDKTVRARWGARASLRLPRYGPSNELQIRITPKEAGPRRIRTCIYYRNVLLQSVVLEAEVAEEGEASEKVVAKEKVITGRTTDYVATVDFALLDELPQPSLNIFTNADANGTHWVGAFSSSDTSAFQLKSGDMRTFEETTLNTRAENLRDVLIKIEGENAYKFNATLPLSQDDIKRREGYLRDVAISGWRLFHPLFVIHSEETGDNAERLENFRNTTKDSHIISIARCGKNSATLPWAALYSNPIEPNKADQISLCEIFKKQLADNKWSGGKLVEKHDLLDDPKACRSLPDCPLKGAKKKLTICPFGFWGFIHQVEQPLQQVKPTPVDEVPEELKNYDFGQTSFLTRAQTDRVKVAVGTYPAIPEVMDHSADIKGLSNIAALDVDYQDDRDKIMEMLTRGGQHVYYFYCHGDVDQQQKLFRLKLGPSGKPGYIESADLLPDEIKWQTPKPLFIMNGCETMALTPDVTHGFLSTLKALGASGIVGTEVKVWTQLARPFGLQLLTHLLNGMSVGEAFLEVRKYLLRQLNPLGLVYSYYSPATLHLHDPAGCQWCISHIV